MSGYLLQGDAARIPLKDQSVHCVVTSPPYWGLRKYSGDQGRIWGGDSECEHDWNQGSRKLQTGGASAKQQSNKGVDGSGWLIHDAVCQLCGAWYGSLGLEPTPEQHVENIVEICREVRRVLRDDGVFWLNYGDCYATTQNGRPAAEIVGDDRTFRDKPFNTAQFAKAGSLMMMPHRVVLALQQDGWIVRQDLVWYKRNPMPESVNGWRFQDDDLKRGSWRHTRAHEYVFMLVKGMQYFSNQEAVRVSASANTHHRGTKLSPPKQAENTALGHGHKDFVAFTPDILPSRNPRSVLDVPTAPYKGAHYATFPPNLIAPLIRATCPRWVCPVCGQGWAAVVDSGNYERHQSDKAAALDVPNSPMWRSGTHQDGLPYRNDGKSVLGYRPTCEHSHAQEEAVPGIVFDPFVGSGTTVMVANQLLRHGIGLDISMPYLDEQAKPRTNLGSPRAALDGLPLFEGSSEPGEHIVPEND